MKIFFFSLNVIYKKGRNTGSLLWTKNNYKMFSPTDILLKSHLCKTEHGKTQEVLKVNQEQISLFVSVVEQGCKFWKLGTNDNICASAGVNPEPFYSVEQRLSGRALGRDHVFASFTLGVCSNGSSLSLPSKRCTRRRNTFFWVEKKKITALPLHPLVSTARSRCVVCPGDVWTILVRSQGNWGVVSILCGVACS